MWGSDDVTGYDRILESLLKEKIAGRRALSEELTPSRAKESKLAAALKSFVKIPQLRGNCN